MFFFDFWASAVVSFENGFKSPYFSSFYLRCAIFWFSVFFVLMLFWPGFASNLLVFFLSFFGCGGRFV